MILFEEVHDLSKPATQSQIHSFGVANSKLIGSTLNIINSFLVAIYKCHQY